MSEIESKPVVIDAVIEEMAKFEARVLKHVELAERKSLPSLAGNLIFKIIIC